MFALLGLRGVFAALGGAAIALVAFMAWNTVWDNPHVYREGKDFGAAQERIAWEEARRKLLAQMEINRRAAQAEIDAIERRVVEEQRRADEALLDLENEITKTPAPERDEKVLKKSQADALNKIGR